MTQFHPRKRFGQHFLANEYILQKIVDTIAPQADEHLIEIGPGQGVLTALLLPLCRQLDVIEIDRDLSAHLQQRFAKQSTLTIHNGDVLKFDFNSILSSNDKAKIVGNLPYNISTPLLFHLFSYQGQIKSLHFLLQKEVVDRLCATPNSSQYGRLSVMAQYFCDCRFDLAVPPEAFNPPPKVDSAVVSLIPHQRYNLNETQRQQLADIVREAFSYRRKTLSNALKRLVSEDILRQLDIDPMLRPQQITVEEYVRIAASIQVK